MDKINKTEQLRLALREFVNERAWDQFHTPRSLSISISIEASELLEHFQWQEHPDMDPVKVEEVKAEAADVFMYLMLLSERLNFDLVEAALVKLEANRIKYPVELSHGSAAKYTKLMSEGTKDE